MILVVDKPSAQLRKMGERLIVRTKEETKSYPLETLEQIVLTGRGVNASTALMFDLVQRGIDVVYQNRAQHFAFRLVGPVAKHSALRVRQVQTATNPASALALARAVVVGKLTNQAVTLRRYGQELGPAGQGALQTLATQVERAAQAENADILRGHEGSGAAAYFGAWPRLFEAERWNFKGRAYYPPPDAVNAMLSLGYTLLLNEIIGQVYRVGLDPTIGFFHTIDYGRPSLALDLEEEFRPVVVDALVLFILRQGIFFPSDFSARAGGQAGVVMSDDARRMFLGLYQEKLESEIRYPALGHAFKHRKCIELQVQHMARCIMGQDQVYSPLQLS